MDEFNKNVIDPIKPTFDSKVYGKTFPDDWEFCGNMTAQYKQIGNAVPVNLAAAVGRSLIRLFNDHYCPLKSINNSLKHA